MRKLHCLISLLFILLAFKSLSQNNYLSGYIININSDTIRGYIDYFDWDNNPDEIFFKKDLNAEKNIIKPDEIKEFSVQDRFYTSKVVSLDKSSTKTDYLTDNPKTEYSKQLVFLQLLTKSDKSLYYYKDNNKEHFFIVIDNNWQLLIYKKYLKKTVINGIATAVVVENETYKGQLMVYLNNCSSIKKPINNTKYSLKSLQKLFNEYNKCTDSKVNYSIKVESLKYNFGIITGVSLTYIGLSSDYDYPIMILNNKNSIDYTVGLYADVLLPRRFNRLSLYNELLYTRYRIEGKNNSDEYHIGFDYLKLNNMIRYKYPIKSIDLFANLGFSNGYIINELNEKRSSSGYTTIALPAYKYELAFICGAGLNYKRFSGELRYDFGSGFSNVITISSHTSRYSILMGYKF
jgi:hypothetical protein